MTQDATHRVHPVLRAATLTAVFALLALFAARQPGTAWIGAQLRTGDSILSGRGFPTEAAITYVSSGHDPVESGWGYSVLAALAHAVAGPPGLVLLHAAALFTTFLIVVRTARTRASDPLVLAVLLLLGVMACEPRFESGPEIFSWLLLALTLAVLHRYDALTREAGTAAPDGRALRLLVALPILQALWVNVDGLFLLGWLAMGGFLAGSWMERRKPDLRLAAWSIASLAATLLHPYGWRGAAAAFAPARDAASPLASLAGVTFPSYPAAAAWSFLILAILSLAALPRSLRLKRFSSALLALAFLALSARMVRNVPPMVIACLPWLAWSDAGWIAEAAARRGRRIVTGVAVACVAVCVVLSLRVATDAHYVQSRRLTRTGLDWNRLVVPADAAEFAARVGLDRVRVLNHESIGGWLGWKLGTEVYIDPDVAASDPNLALRYGEVLQPTVELEREAERFAIRWIILPLLASPRLMLDLSGSSEWTLAHVDQLAAIFVRTGVEGQEWIDPDLVEIYKARAVAPRPETLPGLGGGDPPGALRTWVSGIWRRQRYPSFDVNLGLFHYSRGEVGHALARFSFAIARSGGAYWEIYGDLGSALYYSGEPQLAREALRIVLSHDPDDPQAVKRLADLAALPGF